MLIYLLKLIVSPSLMGQTVWKEAIEVIIDCKDLDLAF